MTDFEVTFLFIDNLDMNVERSIRFYDVGKAGVLKLFSMQSSLKTSPVAVSYSLLDLHKEAEMQMQKFSHNGLALSSSPLLK